MSAQAREDAQDVTMIVGQLDLEELRKVLAAAANRIRMWSVTSASLPCARPAISPRCAGRTLGDLAHERLAVLEGDTTAIIALLGGDLSALRQFNRICEAMAELGRDEDVLAWARRGIAETRGRQGRHPLRPRLRGPRAQRRSSAESWRCAASSMSGWRPPAPTAPCASPPTRSTPGWSSATPPFRHCATVVEWRLSVRET